MLARELLPESGIAGADHVLIGRQGGIERDFGLLRTELEKALAKLSKHPVRPGPVEGPSFLSGTPGIKRRASTSSARTDGGPSSWNGEA
jgi:ribonuclease P protein component